MTGTPIGTGLARLARTDPDAAALTCGPVTLSRRELDERANCFAHTLQAANIGVTDRVAVVLPNSVDFVVALIAIWKAGGTPVPVSPQMPGPEREAILALAHPKAIVAENALLPTRRTDGEPPVDAISRPWKILASGGSTGKPKLIATTEPGVVERAGLFGLAAQMQENKTALITAPLSHNGPFLSLTSALLFGGHVVLMERFDAHQVLRLTERHQVDWLYVVPTMMHRIWRLPAAQRATAAISSLRIVFHLGAPIAPWLKQEWIDWLGPEKIWELYAGTEAQAATLINGTEWLAHRGSVGRPLIGDIQIRDSAGRLTPPGRTGEVWMRAESSEATYTYIGATPRAARGWESLGDLGYLDTDGYLYLTDRDTDMILVGGSNVYPAEIEGALEQHPAIRSAAVIGLPDPDLGQIPHAIIHTDSPVDDTELHDHLKHRLAGYKLPRTFERVAHPLRDDTGKVRRTALRDARTTIKPPQTSEK